MRLICNALTYALSVPSQTDSPIIYDRYPDSERSRYRPEMISQFLLINDDSCPDFKRIFALDEGVAIRFCSEVFFVALNHCINFAPKLIGRTK